MRTSGCVFFILFNFLHNGIDISRIVIHIRKFSRVDHGCLQYLGNRTFPRKRCNLYFCHPTVAVDLVFSTIHACLCDIRLASEKIHLLNPHASTLKKKVNKKKKKNKTITIIMYHLYIVKAKYGQYVMAICYFILISGSCPYINNYTKKKKKINRDIFSSKMIKNTWLAKTYKNDHRRHAPPLNEWWIRRKTVDLMRNEWLYIFYLWPKTIYNVYNVLKATIHALYNILAVYFIFCIIFFPRWSATVSRFWLFVLFYYYFYLHHYYYYIYFFTLSFWSEWRDCYSFFTVLVEKAISKDGEKNK